MQMHVTTSREDIVMEYKSVAQNIKTIEGRIVTGIFAVHGNVDSGQDRSFPGTFVDTKVNGRLRARFLWQHDSSAPPTAAIKSIREVSRTELPPSVLNYAPDATGGVEVIREYLDTPRANEVFEGIKAGAIDEMSYAYEITDSKDETVGGLLVRNIFKADLYDISDVNWGMNPATVGAKSQPIEVQHATVLAAVADYTNRYKTLSELRAKEGRVLSGDNRKRIEGAMEALTNAIKALQDLLSATEPQKDMSKAALAVYAEYQRLQAQFNGALLS